MDLEHWTRDELEIEARRLGIDEPELRSRTQLLHAIRKVTGDETEGPLGTARSLLRVAVDVARSIAGRNPLQLGSEHPTADLHPGSDRPSRSSRPTPSRPTPSRRHSDMPTDPPRTRNLRSPLPERPGSTDRPSERLEARSGETRVVQSVPPPPKMPTIDVLSEGDPPTSDRLRIDPLQRSMPREGSSERPTPRPMPRVLEPHDSARPTDAEPFETRTMARILARQGYRERALAIYERLVERNPDDGALRRERRALLDGEDPETVRASEHPEPIVLASMAPGQAVVAWQLESGLLARARRLYGASGSLTTSLVVVAPDPGEIVKKSELRRPAAERGEWIVEKLPEGALVTAAVGLLEGDRFVSLRHTPIVTLD